MNITLAITGASGAIYAAELLKELVLIPQVSKIALVMTQNGIDVAVYELGAQQYEELRTLPKVTVYENEDMFTPIASGSAAADAMVIVPCSMGMAARIANGISNDLISRAADVMLKERRALVMVVRETPLSLIHLNNLTALTSAGAVVMPACPSFYHKPQTIAELVRSTVERILQQININKTDSYRWRESE